jgi:hypothetical protein
MSSFRRGDLVAIKGLSPDGRSVNEIGLVLSSDEGEPVSVYSSSARNTYSRELFNFTKVESDIVPEYATAMRKQLKSQVSDEVAEDLSRSTLEQIVRLYLEGLGETGDPIVAAGAAVNEYLPEELERYESDVSDILFRSRDWVEERCKTAQEEY